MSTIDFELKLMKSFKVISTSLTIHTTGKDWRKVGQKVFDCCSNLLLMTVKEDIINE
jgi:hypothetical protein